MKKYCVLALVAMFMLVSCDMSTIKTLKEKVAPVDESGNIIKKSLKFADFDEMEVAGSMNVKFFQREGKPSVELVGSDNVIDALDITAKDNKLKIRFKPLINIRYKKLDITVYAPSLKEIKVAGSGGVEFTEGLKTGDLECGVAGSGYVKGIGVECDKLELDVAGSGVIKLAKIISNKVDVDIAGSGKVELTGKTEKCDFDISGSGYINAKGLEAEVGSIDIAGSGDIECNVNQLSQDVAGSGKVNNIKEIK